MLRLFVLPFRGCSHANCKTRTSTSAQRNFTSGKYCGETALRRICVPKIIAANTEILLPIDLLLSALHWILHNVDNDIEGRTKLGRRLPSSAAGSSHYSLHTQNKSFLQSTWGIHNRCLTPLNQCQLCDDIKLKTFSQWTFPRKRKLSVRLKLRGMRWLEINYLLLLSIVPVKVLTPALKLQIYLNVKTRTELHIAGSRSHDI